MTEEPLFTVNSHPEDFNIRSEGLDRRPLTEFRLYHTQEVVSSLGPIMSRHFRTVELEWTQGTRHERGFYHTVSNTKLGPVQVRVNICSILSPRSVTREGRAVRIS